MTERQDLVRRLSRAIGAKRCLGPVSDSKIDAAEAALGIRFPASYREFLKLFGAAWLPPFEIAGLPEPPEAEDTPGWVDVVAVNVRHRRASRGRLPKALLWITDDGSDYAFYLDTSVADDCGECCMRLFGPGREGVVVANSFLDFIERIAAGGVEAVLK